MKKVYFDNAATTQLRNEVVDTMAEVLRTEFGNPSSTHSFGMSSKALLENCRKEIAKLFGAEASEIIFTSGGTEADNMVLESAVRDLEVKNIISSKIEHHAVLHTIEHLSQVYGVTLQFVNLTREGDVDLEHLKNLLSSTKEKTLVTLMHINNEVGNMLPILEVARLCKEYQALFHSDMVQSIGHLEVDFSKIPIDFAAAAAHKFHGPKGVGFAFIRKNTGLKPLILGGGQERGMRAGTEAVYAIVGMTEALKLSYKNLEEEKKYILDLKSYFIDALKSNIKGVQFNGSSAALDKSTYTLLNVNLPISKEKAMLLVFQLDLKGIACSQGSACQSGASGGSHVLNTILSSKDLQNPSIRFSFSKYNNKEEVDYVVKVLSEFINS